MDDAHRMGIIQGAGDLGDQGGRFAKGQPPHLQKVLERHALHKLGHDHGQAVKRLDVVDDDDVRMAKLGGGAGLALETLAFFLVGQEAGVRDLEGDDAVELGIARLPDGAEAAQAKALEELEFAERLHAAGGVGVAGIAEAEA